MTITRYEIIRDFDRFNSLRDQWNALVKQTGVDHAFMRHEWFVCWTKHHDKNCQLEIHTAWDNDKLIAIAPMQTIIKKQRGVKIKITTFLYSSIAPRCNFIIADELDLPEFFTKLISECDSTLMELRGLQTDLPGTTTLLDYLKKNIPDSFMLEPGRTAPFTIIKNSWDDYYEKLPGSFKRNIRASARRLEKAESWEIKKIDSWPELEPYFKSLIEVSAQSWKAAEKSDLAAVPGLTDFYREFASTTSDDNLWECFLLIVANEVIAFDFLLKHDQKRSGIRSDYDLRQKYYMPGIVLRSEILKSYHELNQPIEYDFVGIATDHKSGWTDQLRDHLTITINTSGAIGRSLLWAKRKLVPLVRFGLSYDKTALCTECQRLKYSDWPQWYCGEAGRQPEDEKSKEETNESV